MSKWNISRVVLYGIFSLLFGIVLGAVGHERDMHRNLKNSGDASAWTVDIHSREMMRTLEDYTPACLLQGKK